MFKKVFFLIWPIRILLFLGSVTAFFYCGATAALLYSVPPITDLIRNFQQHYPVLSAAFAVVGAALCLCFFGLALLAVFFPRRSDTLTFFKEKSRLQFSRRAVESTVRYSFQDLPGINYTKIHVRIHRHPEKTRVFVRLSTDTPTQLLNLSEAIREKVETQLQSSLGLRVQSVDIKVTGVTGAHKDPHPEPEGAAEHTRVI